MSRPWWRTHPRKYWTATDWAAARKAGVAPPALPALDPAERLLIEQAQGAPKMTWGPPPSAEDRRRREANRVLEEAGLKPRRW